MSTKASARPEQIKQPLVNLASLPREEALARARTAGREILGDSDVLRSAFDKIWMNWIDDNMSAAAGQTDDEFGELMDELSEEFFAGLQVCVQSFQSSLITVTREGEMTRVKRLVEDESRRAWSVHNILEFMIKALDDDTPGRLPVRCTLVDLRETLDRIATNLMDLVDGARDEGRLEVSKESSHG